MPLPRALLPFLSVLLLALLVAACGSDGSTDDRTASPEAADSGRPDDGGPTSTDDDARARGPASEERVGTAAGGGIAIAPAVARCLADAGFAPVDMPPPGAIAAWRSDSGGTVAIAPSAEDAAALASALASATAPGTVEGRIAGAGDPALRDAAIACLRPATGPDA